MRAGANSNPPAQITGGNAEAQISELKKRDGGDIVTFGSPILVQALANAGLVDQYQILVHPVVVHEGRRLFENMPGAHGPSPRWSPDISGRRPARHIHSGNGKAILMPPVPGRHV